MNSAIEEKEWLGRVRRFSAQLEILLRNLEIILLLDGVNELLPIVSLPSEVLFVPSAFGFRCPFQSGFFPLFVSRHVGPVIEGSLTSEQSTDGKASLDHRVFLELSHQLAERQVPLDIDEVIARELVWNGDDCGLFCEHLIIFLHLLLLYVGVILLRICRHLRDDLVRSEIDRVPVVLFDVVDAEQPLVNFEEDESCDRGSRGCNGCYDTPSDHAAVMPLRTLEPPCVGPQVGAGCDPVNVVIRIIILFEVSWLKRWQAGHVTNSLCLFFEVFKKVHVVCGEARSLLLAFFLLFIFDVDRRSFPLRHRETRGNFGASIFSRIPIASVLTVLCNAQNVCEDACSVPDEVDVHILGCVPFHGHWESLTSAPEWESLLVLLVFGVACNQILDLVTIFLDEHVESKLDASLQRCGLGKFRPF
mmetsp:Transcript_10787/g.19666  ORF Transcript_10787/g.19666 Transcript_10787/m.19666 type:complete len:418 (-) Transcript_10787:2287-3540(-)